MVSVALKYLAGSREATYMMTAMFTRNTPVARAQNGSTVVAMPVSSHRRFGKSIQPSPMASCPTA